MDGRNIPEDLVIIGKNNTISAQKTFNNLTITENLHMDHLKTVQTVDVSEWAKTAIFFDLLPNGTLYYIINGTKTFTNGVSLGEIR